MKEIKQVGFMVLFKDSGSSPLLEVVNWDDVYSTYPIFGTKEAAEKYARWTNLKFEITQITLNYRLA